MKMVRSKRRSGAYTAHPSRRLQHHLHLLRNWSYRRPRLLAVVIVLYALYYVATTDNFLQAGAKAIDTFCTSALNTTIFSPWSNYIAPALNVLVSVVHTLIEGACSSFDLINRVVIKQVS